MPNSWRELLGDEFDKKYFGELNEFVEKEYQTNEVFPPQNQLFRALELCPPSDVKVVIVGQDPYHGEGQANGLAFSVAKGVKLPPSLKNIFKVLPRGEEKTSGELDNWASQGVLMLNAVLSVRAHCPASHAKKGWEKFTDAILNIVQNNNQNVVYMLWGSYAQQKAKGVDVAHNLVINSVHPSPLSAHRGWFTAQNFEKADEYLAKYNKRIIW